MIVKLPFGRDNTAVDLRGLRVRPLQPDAPRGSRDLGRLLSRAVDYPVEGSSLVDRARSCRSAVIVVPDATRNIELPKVLPVVLNRLLVAGIEAGSIEVLVACGTHPAVSDEALQALVGPVPHGVAIRQHDSRDETSLTTIGALRPEIPLRLDRRSAEADLVVTIGAVRHHYFAGFGGGPKMIFPGIAGYDEIQANHSLVLRRGPNGLERHSCCEPGVLEGNPVATEIARAVDLGPDPFALCLVPGRNGGSAWAAAGPWRPAFQAAVEQTKEWYELSGGGYEYLVAGGGGPPGDANLIQAHKSLDAICRFAAPGAEVIFVADLGEGAGSPAMEPFLDDPRPEVIIDRLAERYVQYGHTTLRIIEKTSRFRIYLKSSMDPELATRLGFIPVDDLDEIAERWRAKGVRDRVAVMSEAPVWPRKD